MTRLDWLRAWFASARSTFIEATFERWFWIVVSIAGIFVRGMRESIPALYFMSGWALVKGASNERMGAKREMLKEHADEAGEQASVDQDGDHLPRPRPDAEHE